MFVRWDVNKEARNITLHGVDFASAAIALTDPFALTVEDGDNRGESAAIQHAG